MDIQKIEVPIEIRALKTANSYLINGSILFDTGMSENSYREIISKINPGAIKYIIISHLHIDHIGGAGYFNKNYGIPVFISQNDYNYIERINENPEAYFKFYTDFLRSNGTPDSIIDMIMDYNPIVKYINYYEGLDIKPVNNKPEGFDIIDVPGHTPGSIVLYNKNSLSLLSGDHILGRITPNISVYLPEMDSLKMYLESLEKIQNLNVSNVYPGHGNVFNNYHERIIQIKKHHGNRITVIKNYLNSWKTVYDIASTMEWSRGRHMDTMNFMEKNFAIMETAAHLIYMENSGIIRGIEKNGIKYYSL
ncbi:MULTISPECIES: MBL fold metallo-hydrolase [Acidiplasma]|jgi:glyoxylase-like metal-dependent hydrolase (beta-lactamase superfamily II)|uniref:Metallo-beta-lactamase domain-containing protein n=1 Tax=Acidiplasma cupricumulans TaxID=312540 RepID=A0A0Q0RRC0_9ARCH|nr:MULTISPECIES: MBL fold metallo-hydrolase [Acidiplasma]KQB34890.1 hypothetical protein AOG55_08750 [Acidiplasma cupricumulans]WMT55746.1 MAG: MBL fold metallo-hydrolase [Acidiplasma sp.]